VIATFRLAVKKQGTVGKLAAKMTSREGRTIPRKKTNIGELGGNRKRTPEGTGICGGMQKHEQSQGKDNRMGREHYIRRIEKEERARREKPEKASFR